MLREGPSVLNLLVVGRDRDDRRSLQAALGARGLDTAGCASVADALALRAEGIDAVVVCTADPDPTGLTACRSISESWPATPVIVLSDGVALGKAGDAFGAGAFDFLVGPIDRLAITDALEHAARVGRSRKRRESGLTTAVRPESPTDEALGRAS